MLRHVVVVKTDVSEEHSACILREIGIDELGTTLAVTINGRSPILIALMMEALCYSETSVLIRDSCRSIQEDGILHSHRRENP
jgi:hypothetical protein